MKKHFIPISIISFLLLLMACQKESYELDTLFFYPRAFTPNGDGLNDTWAPVGGFMYETVNPDNNTGLDADTYLLDVFDERNKRLLRTDCLNIGWDGSYKGKDCPEGYYYFVCTYRSLEGKKYRDTGVFELLR